MSPLTRVRVNVTKNLWMIAILAVVFSGTLAFAARVQEQAQYTAEEYKAYQAVTAETDPAKKAALVVAFLKERPQSTLRPHVVGDYQKMMQELDKSGNSAAVIAAGEQFITAVPDDILTISLLATAYQKTKNNTKFVVYGEKVFDASPNGNIAYYLAKAYLEMKNDAKFAVWGEKTIGFMPDNYEILLELTKSSGDSRRYPQAIKYGRMCLKAFQSATKPEAMAEKDWRAYSTNLYASCYYIVGSSAFETKDYATTVSNLENSLKYYLRNEFAYYKLAQAYWQQNRIDLAMKNFAKAYLLGGQTSRPARQYLDQLYKSTHQQSLVGEERVIEKAKEELKGS
jgi:tetratricopeptide (TPR) repeat protein